MRLWELQMNLIYKMSELIFMILWIFKTWAKTKMRNIISTVKGVITITLQIKSTLFKNVRRIYYCCLNKHNIYTCRLNSCEFWVFSRYCIRRLLNKFMEWQLMMLFGSWFHNFGPSILIFLAPVSVVVLGMKRLSRCLVLTLFSRISLTVGSEKTHSGSMLFILLNINRHILYINLGFIFNHFNFSNTGVTCSCFFAPPIAILAAKFNTFWIRLIWVLLVDPHTGKQ